MKNKPPQEFIAYFLFLVLVFLFLSGLSCVKKEPIVQLFVTNKTDQVLTIITSGSINKELYPKESTIREFDIWGGKSYSIIAKDTRGITVFDKKYSYDELKNMDFKLSITQPDIISNSDNVSK
jgi:hypothetical protein